MVRVCLEQNPRTKFVNICTVNDFVPPFETRPVVFHTIVRVDDMVCY